MIKLLRSAILAGITIGFAGFGFLASGIQSEAFGPLFGSPSAVKDIALPVRPSTEISVIAAIKASFSIVPAFSIAALMEYTAS